jgi:hypothetical protein
LQSTVTARFAGFLAGSSDGGRRFRMVRTRRCGQELPSRLPCNSALRVNALVSADLQLIWWEGVQRSGRRTQLPPHRNMRSDRRGAFRRCRPRAAMERSWRCSALNHVARCLRDTLPDHVR